MTETSDRASQDIQSDDDKAASISSSLLLRASAGGVLMGLANLVPGISGGTMLVAAGIYPRFVAAVAEISTLKFRRRSLIVLACVVACAALAILLFAGPVKGLVVAHRWAMYSLFIGLTLGGAPLVWRMAQPIHPSVWLGIGAGVLVMIPFALVEPGGGASEGPLLFFVAGIAGASAMILPGISGGYLLLLLGVYVPILSGIDGLKTGLKAGDMAACWDVASTVVIPVGIGVVVGVVGVSNLLKVLLEKAEKPTLGLLIGFLLGSVFGLWPFQRGVQPDVGDVVRGRTMTTELIADLAPEKYPTEFFSPDSTQMVGAVVLVLVGIGLTMLVARFGASEAVSPSTSD